MQVNETRQPLFLVNILVTFGPFSILEKEPEKVTLLTPFFDFFLSILDDKAIRVPTTGEIHQ